VPQGTGVLFCFRGQLGTCHVDDWDAMQIINSARPDFTDAATVVCKSDLRVDQRLGPHADEMFSGADVSFRRRS
jgi:hypothetical protein